MPKLITLAEDAYNALKSGVETVLHEAETLVSNLEQHHASVSASQTAVATNAPSVPPVTPAPTASSLTAAVETVKAHLTSGALTPVAHLLAKPNVSHVQSDANAKPAAVPGTPATAAPAATTPAAPAAPAAAATA